VLMGWSLTSTTTRTNATRGAARSSGIDFRSVAAS
jgi:hypothetical protein